MVVLTAASPEEALEQVGLPACLLLAPEQPGEEHVASIRKRYKVIELDHLQLHLRYSSKGKLDLYDADQRTYESLFELHPRVTLPAMDEQ